MDMSRSYSIFLFVVAFIIKAGGSPMNLSIYDPTNTTMLIFSDQNITGSIPSQIGIFTTLVVFEMEDNRITGSIPSEIGLLTILEFWTAENNLLEGTLPSELGSATNLIELRLDSNYINGTIPSQLGRINNLEALLIASCFLRGSLPSQIGLLTATEFLWFYGNQLTNSIPSEMGQLGSAILLDLSDNQLTSSMPSEIGLMSSMYYYIGVDTNLITGSIPSEMGQMSLIIDGFYLQDNSFDGEIPSELGQLVDLVPACQTTECFSLFSNMLCGDIPSQLGDMSSTLNSGGANYWVTFVEDGNNLGTSCLAPTSLPTTMPIIAPTSGKNNDKKSSDLPDETVIAAIGSLLLIGLIATCYASRTLYLYLVPRGKANAEADWANSNPMMLHNQRNFNSSTDAPNSQLSLGSTNGLSTGSNNPALTGTSSHSKPGANYIGITDTGMAIPGAATNASAMVIPFERLLLDRKPFAAGASGSIFKGTYNGAAVAAKMLFSYTGDKERHEFDREFRMLSTMRHPNIVALYGMAHDPTTDQLYIVQEYVGGGNLHDLSRDGDRFTTSLFINITIELFGALQYMHDSGVAHRDMKPLNLLVTTSGSLRVCDLGLARNYQQSSITANVGTALYMPPEAYDDTATSADTYVASKWDIYSTGMILYELWYRGHPWEKFQAMQIFGKIARQERPPFAPLEEGGPGADIPAELKDLICHLWLDSPSARLSASEACRRFTEQVVPKLTKTQDLTDIPLHTEVTGDEEQSEGSDV